MSAANSGCTVISQTWKTTFSIATFYYRITEGSMILRFNYKLLFLPQIQTIECLNIITESFLTSNTIYVLASAGKMKQKQELIK